MAQVTRSIVQAHHDSSTTEGHHGLQRQGQEAVGPWREAGWVAFMLIFYMVVLGLATHPEWSQ